MYALERFLSRLSRSPYRDRLVLKGGMLLAALDIRRPTADVDLLAQALSNDVDAVAGLIREVLQVEADDGVEYQPDLLTARVIQDAELYSGVRLAVPARVDRAQAILRLDVNVGDPVTPPGQSRWSTRGCWSARSGLAELDQLLTGGRPQHR